MDKLKKLITKSTTPFHLVETVKQELDHLGYKELLFKEKWKSLRGGKYYVCPYSSSIFAFSVGELDDEICNLRIASAHTDFPCLKIKPNSDMEENGYYKLNVEVYGGPILNTWLDRPLSIAGKVALKNKNDFFPKACLVDFNRPVLTIPNLAIHLNKDVNKGVELNKQKDMLPISDILNKEIDHTFLVDQLAKELEVDAKEILDYELFVYQYEQGETIGFENSMFSSPRLDNITSVRACLDGLINGTRKNGISLVAFFDHEEIGSKTNKGAASTLLTMIMEKLYHALDKSKEEYYSDLANGFMISTDVAHCMHPNAPEKNDVTNKTYLNGGVVIKYAASQSYANDCESSGVIIQLCEKHQIKYQKFVNRSDGSSGSTLGSILSTNIPIRTIDIGIPLLAMHSARELMGVNDQKSLSELLEVFFS